MVAEPQRGYTPPPSPMLSYKDAEGRPLYKLTSGGNIARTLKLTRRRKQQVLERDGHACVLCGSGHWLEIDHIVRYADGGSHDLSNLRTLCTHCHSARGRRG